MTNISSAHDLLSTGLTHDDLARKVRNGELIRVRRGAYADARPTPVSASAVHRALVAATVPQLSSDAVLSHTSAALLHGLPVWRDQLTRVHVTRSRPNGGRTGPFLHVHARALAPDHIVLVGGFAVTSLARTVVDLGCHLPFERSVGVGDAALRLGLGRDELAAALEAGGGRVGINRARQAVSLLDVRSESAEESRSRVIFWRHRLPKPELQWEVFDGDGTFVARCDFAWEEFRTVGEFDGKVKYGRLLRPGQDPGSVVFEEKRREDALRDLSLQVVRWVSEDLGTPGGVIDRLERAFERGRRIIT